ncbi:hypothetical protein HYW75_02500 [Candidatus Pacearchaeota archaeon]|nr:hypothetical protein [Candidatus Pacearchaeota archaeon]
MDEEITTIKLRKKTKSRLDNLKEYKRETYEEIINKILDVMNIFKSDPEDVKRRLSLMDQKRWQFMQK